MRPGSGRLLLKRCSSSALAVRPCAMNCLQAQGRPLDAGSSMCRGRQPELVSCSVRGTTCALLSQPPLPPLLLASSVAKLLRVSPVWADMHQAEAKPDLPQSS